jgi:hypothetical protein
MGGIENMTSKKVGLYGLVCGKLQQFIKRCSLNESSTCLDGNMKMQYMKLLD